MAANLTSTPEKEYSRADKNMCRLCGDTKDYIRSTSILSKVGKEKRLAENIENVLNIVIEDSEKSHLPCTICRRCQDLLIKFNEFKTLAIETQEIIKADSFVKRGAKSPNPEPSKRALQLLRLHPKQLDYDLPTIGGIHSNDTDGEENRAENVASPQELLSSCGLNDTKVCTDWTYIHHLANQRVHLQVALFVTQLQGVFL